jgi:two-component system cell cycle response regulator
MVASTDPQGLSSSGRAAVGVWRALAAVGFVLFSVPIVTGLGGHPLNRFADVWLYDGLELLAAFGCFMRAGLVRSERTVWAVLGLAVLSYSLGDLCYDFVYGGQPPTPSLADGFYLGFYPACYVALGLLIRSRISSFNKSVWLDGMIAALASAAVAAAVIFQLVFEHTHGRAATVIVDLAYPLGDVVLLGLVVFVFALTGWRPGREWSILGAALIVITIADSLYLGLSATGGYSAGTFIDVLWPASLLLLAASAWQPRAREHALELEGRLFGAAPISCGIAALAVLVIDDRLRPLNVLAVGLAAGTILAVLLRTALSFRENGRLLLEAREQSMTDPLTLLGNRRRLMVDLERELGRLQDEAWLLVILDLNGFKGYNDSFGHPSGDALLARLGGKLARAAAAAGASAYRLGGDEFCLLAPLSRTDAESLIHAAAASVSEAGEGFVITASFGAAVVPEEAPDVSSAMRVADQRLYLQKAALYRERGESYEVLLRALSEREPSLREHVRGVAELSVSVGSRLGLSEPTLKELALAAELHDVGKLAIPDAVLTKPGPLNAEEWAFIRQHTAIGQRILAGAPALRGVGDVVRSTHERWDGAGYGDGLAGDAIPQSARIIAVCDAYAAMTSERPYRVEVTQAEALAELRSCAGTQFDPEVVEVFCAMMLERDELFVHDPRRGAQGAG